MSITLTTDFGNDTYVGIMKGVILSINPNIQIIDVNHHIEPQNIDQAAFILKTAVPYFPNGTIHCIVVDPGVGSGRAILLIETDTCLLVAPDNGVLKYIFNEQSIKSVYQVTNLQYRLNKISSTFHGRDIFAPAAAYLSLGIPPSEFGSKYSQFVKGEVVSPVIQSDKIVGEILFFDHFGNAITNIPDKLVTEQTSILINGMEIPLHATYSNVENKSALALVGSHQHLEIAIRNGNAREHLALKKGQTITLLKKDN